MFFTPSCREVSGDEGSRHTSRTRGRTMSSSSYLFTFLNALPIIMVATKKTSKPWDPLTDYKIPVCIVARDVSSLRPTSCRAC